MAFDLSKAVVARVVLIYGAEEALKARALADLKEALGLGEDAFDYQEFVANSSAPVEWYASVCTAPFFSPKRVAVVRNLLRVSSDDLGNVNLATVPESGLLVLVADSEGGDDDKQRRLAKIEAGWIKAITTAKGYAGDCKVDPKEETGIVRRECERFGKTMTENVARILLEVTGGLSEAIHEVEKLCLYVAESKAIGEHDVRAVAIASKDWNVYKLVDAMIAGNATEGLGQLDYLLGTMNKPTDAALSSILPTLSKSLRLIFQAKIAIEKGGDAEKIPPSALDLFPDKPNLASEKDWLRRRYFNWAKSSSLPSIAAALQLVSDTDCRLKGAISGFTPKEALERMVIDLTNIFRTKVAVR